MKENNTYPPIESDMGDPNMEWEDITICADCKFKPQRPYSFICENYKSMSEMNKAVFSDKCKFHKKK